MTYSYENEYRISLNMKDKSEQIETDHIDDSTIKLHAYIQDDNGQRYKVMYKDVIIGPKVKDIDYVAPYIKLCDGTINVRKSKIKYRTPKEFCQAGLSTQRPSVFRRNGHLYHF